METENAKHVGAVTIDGMGERRWYVLHWVTWLAVLVMGTALLWSQFFSGHGLQPFLGPGRNWYYDTGWPLFHDMGRSEWQWPVLLLNLAMSLVVLASTATAVEIWRRKMKRYQLSIRSLLIATGIVAAVVFIAKLEAQPIYGVLHAPVFILIILPWLATFFAAMNTLERCRAAAGRPVAQLAWLLVFAAVYGAAVLLMQTLYGLLVSESYGPVRWNRAITRGHWQIAVALAFGVACTIYTVGWIGVCLAARCWRKNKGDGSHCVD